MPKLNKLQKMGELKNLYAYISAIQSIRVTYFCHHTSPKRTTTYLNWMQMEQIEAKMCTVCGLLGKIRTHSTLFQKEGGGLCYYMYVDTLTIIQGHLLFEIWALSFFQVKYKALYETFNCFVWKHNKWYYHDKSHTTSFVLVTQRLVRMSECAKVCL